MKIYEAKLIYRAVGEADTTPLDSPEKVVNYMKGAFSDPTVEWFYAILLTRKNTPIGRIVVTQGTASTCLVHPREVFKAAILRSASSVICVHNHPSGDPSPSSADVKVTRQLREAGNILDIQLLDHVIIGDPDSDSSQKQFYSFRESGII